MWELLYILRSLVPDNYAILNNETNLGQTINTTHANKRTKLLLIKLWDHTHDVPFHHFGNCFQICSYPFAFNKGMNRKFESARNYLLFKENEDQHTLG